jgi:hypothetical protein
MNIIFNPFFYSLGLVLVNQVKKTIAAAAQPLPLKNELLAGCPTSRSERHTSASLASL